MGCIRARLSCKNYRCFKRTSIKLVRGEQSRADNAAASSRAGSPWRSTVLDTAPGHLPPDAFKLGDVRAVDTFVAAFAAPVGIPALLAQLAATLRAIRGGAHGPPIIGRSNGPRLDQRGQPFEPAMHARLHRAGDAFIGSSQEVARHWTVRERDAAEPVMQLRSAGRLLDRDGPAELDRPNPTLSGRGRRCAASADAR